MQNTLQNITLGRDSRDWLANLIGTPYESGAHGPDKFDCWGLLVYIYRNLLGIELPDFFGFENIRDYPRKIEKEVFNSSDWEEIAEPEPFCGVAMSRSKVLHHVGIWLDINGGLCFHAFDGAAVVAEPVHRLKANGFSRIIFLRYNGKGIQNNEPTQSTRRD